VAAGTGTRVTTLIAVIVAGAVMRIHFLLVGTTHVARAA